MLLAVTSLLVLLKPTLALEPSQNSIWPATSPHQILSGGVFKDEQNNTRQEAGSEGAELGSGPPGTYDVSTLHQMYPPGGISDNRLGGYPNVGGFGNSAYRPPYRVPEVLDNRIYDDPRQRQNGMMNYPYRPQNGYPPSNGYPYDNRQTNSLPYDLQQNGLPYGHNDPSYYRPNRVNPYMSPNVYQPHDERNRYSVNEMGMNDRTWFDPSLYKQSYNPYYFRNDGRSSYTPQGVYTGPGTNWNGYQSPQRPYSEDVRGFRRPFMQRDSWRSQPRDPRLNPNYPFSNTAPIQFTNQ